MNDFPKTVLTTFASIGILSKLLLTVFTSSKDGSIGPASASIWGNLIIIFSLISYLSIEENTLETLIYPIYLIVLVLLWDTAVSYKYFERINKKEIPSLYYSWNTLLNLIVVRLRCTLNFCYVSDRKPYRKPDGSLVYYRFFFFVYYGHPTDHS